jgi:lysophospholipase L1-like esterase
MLSYKLWGFNPSQQGKMLLIIALIFVCLLVALIMLERYWSKTAVDKKFVKKGFALVYLVFFLAFYITLEESLIKTTSLFYRYDPILFWRPVARQGSNAEGFRTAEVPEFKAPGEYRILALGDSSIFGDKVSAESNVFTSVLEEKLRSNFPRPLRVINAGVPGYSSYQGLYLFDEIKAKYKPDLLLLGYFNSDSLPDIMEDKYRNPNPSWIKAIQKVLAQSMLYQFIHIEILRFKKENFFPPLPRRVNRVSVADYRKNLETFILWAKHNSCGVILLNMPPDLSTGHYLEYRNVLYELADRYKLPVADFYKIWTKKGWLSSEYYADNIHPNDKGHRKMADILYDLIIKEVWGGLYFYFGV